MANCFISSYNNINNMNKGSCIAAANANEIGKQFLLDPMENSSWMEFSESIISFVTLNS